MDRLSLPTTVFTDVQSRRELFDKEPLDKMEARAVEANMVVSKLSFSNPFFTKGFHLTLRSITASRRQPQRVVCEGQAASDGRDGIGVIMAKIDRSRSR